MKKAETEQLILTDCLLAQTCIERTKGLLGWKTLEQRCGMLITPCKSIHTFFMSFPLDIVFLDVRRIIVKLVPNLPPWRISGCLGAAAVLEAPVGTIASCGLEVGDQLNWQSHS